MIQIEFDFPDEFSENDRMWKVNSVLITMCYRLYKNLTTFPQNLLHNRLTRDGLDFFHMSENYPDRNLDEYNDISLVPVIPGKLYRFVFRYGTIPENIELCICEYLQYSHKYIFVKLTKI